MKTREYRTAWRELATLAESPVISNRLLEMLRTTLDRTWRAQHESAPPSPLTLNFKDYKESISRLPDPFTIDDLRQEIRKTYSFKPKYPALAQALHRLRLAGVIVLLERGEFGGSAGRYGKCSNPLSEEGEENGLQQRNR